MDYRLGVEKRGIGPNRVKLASEKALVPVLLEVVGCDERGFPASVTIKWDQADWNLQAEHVLVYIDERWLTFWPKG